MSTDQSPDPATYPTEPAANDAPPSTAQAPIKPEEAAAALRLVGQACAAYHGNRTDHISLERALQVLQRTHEQHFAGPGWLPAAQLPE